MKKKFKTTVGLATGEALEFSSTPFFETSGEKELDFRASASRLKRSEKKADSLSSLLAGHPSDLADRTKTNQLGWLVSWAYSRYIRIGQAARQVAQCTNGTQNNYIVHTFSYLNFLNFLEVDTVNPV